MKSIKINETELNRLKVSSLTSRPTSPISEGGNGMSPAEMKSAFDRLPLFLAERFNLLIDKLTSIGDGSAAESIQTGIREGHTLSKLFSDIASGELSSYLMLAGESLAIKYCRLEERLSLLESQLSSLAENTVAKEAAE